MAVPDYANPIVLSRQACLERLALTPVGRIGVSIDALPVILPIHFRLIDEALLFRILQGTRLDEAATGAVVAFQTDAPDASDGGWWSILVQGVATPVDHLETEVPEPWRWPGPAVGSRLLRLSAATMAGRHFGAAAGAQGPVD